MEAKMVSFMTLIIIFGVSLNLIFGTGLTLFTLLILILGYGFSRTRRYSVASYLIIGILLFATIRSLIVMGNFDSYVIFSNLAWLTLSLVFSSLLLSIRETILIAVGHLIFLYLLSIAVPEINLNEMVVSFGFICVFSALLVITMWQRNVLEDARQEKIRQQATHDQLTGLPNRTLFHDRLEQALARMERNGTVGSIFYLDLDDFKNINDEFSHDAGDHVLKVIAERIQNCIRKMDTGARFSGDEFVIMLEDVNGSRNAAQIARKILNTISIPIKIQNSEVMVSGSLGIAMIPKDGEDSSDLLINADTAMYSAKNDGKNAISFFTSEMKDKMLYSITMSKNIQRAFEKHEFYLEYQPQYDACSRRVVGAEALLRWQHPELGAIHPNEFIPIAEQNGMIIQMGEWLIGDMFSFHQSMGFALHSNIRLAANLSGRQLRDDQFAKYLAELIEDSGVDPNFLELEITENSIFENFEQTLSILKQIKSLGIRLAIDDFGTGYSSLSYLEKLPFDTVKIDTSFIQKITGLDVHLPILTGIISIATDLGLDVIAEGVENETQLKFLQSHGCHLIQGHYFNPSFSEQDLLQVLSEQNILLPQQSVPIQMA